MSEAYRCIGSNCSIKSEFPPALDYYFKALKISEETGDKRGIAQVMGYIGNVYKDEGNYNKALEYEEDALKFSEELGDKKLISVNQGYMALVYSHLKNYKKALEYMYQALKIDEEIGDKWHMAYAEMNIGIFYGYLHSYNKTMQFAFRALRTNEALGDKNGMATDLTNIAYYYNEIAKDTTGNIKADSLIPADKNASLRKAIYYYGTAIPLNKESGHLVGLQDCYLHLSQADSQSGNYKRALENYKQYKRLQDSIFSNDSKVKVANEGTQRAELLEQKQKELTNEIASKRSLEKKVFISGIVLLAGIIIFIFRNNKLLAFEKRRSDGLLLNILPVKVADELKEKGTADAKLYGPVTVFFSDFVSFTSVSERLTPQQLVAELHACFKGFDEIIKKYQIEKIKTVGDAYLMVSGLPAANPNHATDIIAAAMEIRDFMVARKAQLGDNTFGVRIGVNTGSVVAGIVGVTKFAYDIWGDTVNTAARMEQNSEAGKINISASTYLLVKDKYHCEYRGKIAAKNKGEIDMYFVSAKQEVVAGTYATI